METRKSNIVIATNFDPGTNGNGVEKAFQNFRTGIFNALLQKYIPLDQQEMVIEQLVQEGYIK